MNLLSDLVLDLLELLEIPKEQVSDELEANIETVKTLDKAEDLMVHLSLIAKRIVNKEPLDSALEPTQSQVRLQAAKMAMCYLALLS